MKLKKILADRQMSDTEKVFHKNEVQANKFTCNIMIAYMLGMLYVILLDRLDIIDISLKSNFYFICECMVAMAMSLCLSVLFKYDRPWLKTYLMVVLTAVMAITNNVFGFDAVLVTAIPVIVSSRYYSKKLSVFIAVMSIADFFWQLIYFGFFTFISCILTAINDDTIVTFNDVLTLFIDTLGENSIIMTGIGTVGGAGIIGLIVFLIIAYTSVLIADKGHKMVLEQDKVSRENSRIETELDVARTIQKQALPLISSLSEHNSFDIAASMNPAKEVGGDFYSFIPVDEKHLALMIADVSGKGVPAAMFMMASKLLLDGAVADGERPGKIFEDVNRQLCEKNMDDMFVTVWLGIVDLTTGHVLTANAGHEYPIIARKDGQIEVFKDKHGLVLGGIEGVHYTESEFWLKPGDALFVYTDGVTEANNESGEQYGMDRIVSCINRVGFDNMDKMLSDIKGDIDKFAGRAEQFDDITMMSFKIKELKTGLEFAK